MYFPPGNHITIGEQLLQGLSAKAISKDKLARASVHVDHAVLAVAREEAAHLLEGAEP